MTRSAKCVFAPGNVVIHLEAGHRRIVRVMFFKMSIYARSGRLGLPELTKVAHGSGGTVPLRRSKTLPIWEPFPVTGRVGRFIPWSCIARSV